MLGVETVTDPSAGPPQHTDESPPGAPLHPADGRVVGGVAFELATRLGLDPLWVRLAFVGLTLAGGLGIVLYAALWLVLVIGRRPGASPVPWAIAAAVVVLVWAASDAPDDMRFGWPTAGAIVLGGGALALWQPRPVSSSRSWGAPAPDERTPTTPTDLDDPPIGGDGTTQGAGSSRAGDGDAGGDERRRGPWPSLQAARSWRSRRERSVLGRAVLGVAVVAAAGGSAIDQLNGGRLHPEQWLGVGAAVCGFGIVLGAWRGRAWWLVVPALGFAGSGWVAGHAARAGVDELRWGDAWIDVSSGQPPSTVLSERRIVGTVFVNAYQVPADAPADPVHVDVVVGIGKISIMADDDLTVEVRPHADDGVVRLNVEDGGASTSSGDREPFTIGPEGSPDVVVEAAISRGDIDVHQYDIYDIDDMSGAASPASEGMPGTVPAQAAPDVTVPSWLGDGVTSGVDIGEGLRMAPDGTVILPDNQAALGVDGELWTLDGLASPRRDGVTLVDTSAGPFMVLPNQMLIAPSGMFVDVPGLRERQRVGSDDTTSSLPSDAGSGPATGPTDR